MLPQAEAFVETCDYCTKTEIVFGGGSTAGNFTSGYEPDYELIVMIDGKVVEEETEVALGRWIDIVVQPTSGVFYGQGYQFDHWSAPGNLLNGERSERARFMLMPPPSGNTLSIGPVFHRNRLTLPSSVDERTYSYEDDEGSSVADISAEVSAASGWVALAGHRGESVTLISDGFDGSRHTHSCNNLSNKFRIGSARTHPRNIAIQKRESGSARKHRSNIRGKKAWTGFAPYTSGIIRETTSTQASHQIPPTSSQYEHLHWLR